MNEYYCVDTYLVKAIGKRLDAEQPVVEPTWREQFGPLAKRVEAIDRACETQCDDINAALQRIDALEARLREDGGDPPLAPAPEPEFGPDYDEQNTRYTYALARAEAAEAECLRLQNSVASFLERAHVSGRYESLMREKIRNVEAERDALKAKVEAVRMTEKEREAWDQLLVVLANSFTPSVGAVLNTLADYTDLPRAGIEIASTKIRLVLKVSGGHGAIDVYMQPAGARLLAEHLRAGADAVERGEKYEAQVDPPKAGCREVAG